MKRVCYEGPGCSCTSPAECKGMQVARAKRLQNESAKLGGNIKNESPKNKVQCNCPASDGFGDAWCDYNCATEIAARKEREEKGKTMSEKFYLRDDTYFIPCPFDSLERAVEYAKQRIDGGNYAAEQAAKIQVLKVINIKFEVQRTVTARGADLLPHSFTNDDGYLP